MFIRDTILVQEGGLFCDGTINTHAQIHRLLGPRFSTASQRTVDVAVEFETDLPMSSGSTLGCIQKRYVHSSSIGFALESQRKPTCHSASGTHVRRSAPTIERCAMGIGPLHSSQGWTRQWGRELDDEEREAYWVDGAEV